MVTTKGDGEKVYEIIKVKYMDPFTKRLVIRILDPRHSAPQIEKYVRIVFITHHK